jgi:hypothetical protein
MPQVIATAAVEARELALVLASSLVQLKRFNAISPGLVKVKISRYMRFEAVDRDA